MRGLPCSQEWRLIAQGKAIITSALITGLQKELAVKLVSLLYALTIKESQEKNIRRTFISKESIFRILTAKCWLSARKDFTDCQAEDKGKSISRKLMEICA